MWAWGSNIYGNLGTSDTTHRSSPVQVGDLSTWTKISTGTVHSLAIQSDGTLWAWGNDIYGNLGTGLSIGMSSPVQVGSLSTWTQISCGYYHTVGISSKYF